MSLAMLETTEEISNVFLNVRDNRDLQCLNYSLKSVEVTIISETTGF